VTQFSLWTIYDRPTDYPDSFVARRFELDQPTGDIFIAATLAKLRAILALRCAVSHCIPRDPNDDPKIVEVWI